MSTGPGEQQATAPRFARADGAPWRWTGDRVIVAVGDDEFRELGGLAMPVWMLLDRPRTAASLGAELVEVLPDAPDDVEERVVDALADLGERGLVRTLGAAGEGSSSPASPPSSPPRPSPASPPRAPSRPTSSSPPSPPLSPPSPSPRPDPVPNAARVDDRDGDPVERVLRSLLVPDPPEPEDAPVIALSEEEAATLVGTAVSRRLTGPLLWLVRTGAVELPEEARAGLEARHRAALLWCLHLERRLIEFLDRVEPEGIRPIVLKGPSVAHLDRFDEGLRTFADLDLLIPAEHLDAVVDLLLAEGGQRPWPQRRPGFDARFAKSVTITMPDGVEMDLHRTLCDGVHGFRIPVEELHADAVTFDLAGRPVAALGAEHRLLHAAYHAVLGSTWPAAHSLADLAGCLSDAGIDRDRVIETARRWRGTAVLVAAIDATVEAVDLTGAVAGAWVAWRESVVVDADEQRIVEAQRADGSSFGLSRLRAMRELPRSDRLAYAAAILWPTREHLRARGRRRRDVLATVTSRLRRRA